MPRCFFWPEAPGLRPVDRRQATGDRRQGPGAGVESGAAEERTGEGVLDVKHVARHFGRPSHPVRAVDGVSFSVQRGQVFGLVAPIWDQCNVLADHITLNSVDALICQYEGG